MASTTVRIQLSVILLLFPSHTFRSPLSDLTQRHHVMSFHSNDDLMPTLRRFDFSSNKLCFVGSENRILILKKCEWEDR